MNYIYLLLEILLVFLLMILFYKINKKDGLYQYISLLAIILSVVVYKTVDIISFKVNLDIPLLMGIFICNNIIIQKYGPEKTKKIITTFALSYLITFIIISFISLISPSEYNAIGNLSFDNLFGYQFSTFRIAVASVISISFLLWYDAVIYYFIRINKNKLLFSNIGTILIIQFIESIIFIIISYIGIYDIVQMFGMIVIRYLLKIVIGIIGLLPVYMILKMKEK